MGVHLACKRTCRPTRDACRHALGQPGHCNTRVQPLPIIPTRPTHPFPPA